MPRPQLAEHGPRDRIFHLQETKARHAALSPGGVTILRSPSDGDGEKMPQEEENPSLPCSSATGQQTATADILQSRGRTPGARARG